MLTAQHPDCTHISDGAYGKPWVFRPKDFRSWWSNFHKNRTGGVETLRERWQDVVAWLLVGSIWALYNGPLVNPLIKPMIRDLVPKDDSTGFASFLVGLGGISVVGLLFDLVRNRMPKSKENGDAQV